MIVIVKDSARPEQIEKLKENFESMGPAGPFPRV